MFINSFIGYIKRVRETENFMITMTRTILFVVDIVILILISFYYLIVVFFII